MLQKNLRILLQDAQSVETLAYAIKDKNNLNSILNVIDQSMEKIKSLKKFNQNNYDWSSQLIVSSLKNKFCNSKQAPEEFQKFISVILGAFETEIAS